MFKPALLALCYWPALLCAQVGSLGLPPVVNYPKSAYRAGTQNWDIAQDAQGRILVANNEGLLLHDGVFWQKHPIANGTCVRSVAQAPDGHIYVGGQGEIGQFSPDAQGRLAYRSLTPLIPEGDRQFADVWDVVVGDDGAVYFRSDERLFQWKEGRIRPLSTGGRTLFFGKAGGQLLVHDANNGLLRFDGQHFTLLPGHPKPPSPVTALIALGGDSLLVATLKHGLFCWAGQRWAAWPTPIDNFLREKRIYCATALPGGQIALGSSMGGLVVLGRDRRPLQWLQKTEGLQNANILSVFTDRSHNLWLGLDNGMALVETSSPFYRLLPDGPLEGTGYAARVWGGQLWLGSSNGLFVQPY
ncbi:MAG TPA: hypothetical protein PKW90_13225, partial [Myxococcota bacterium]|nr:hypothetical protein [Myxococcota bacterium]